MPDKFGSTDCAPAQEVPPLLTLLDKSSRRYGLIPVPNVLVSSAEVTVMIYLYPILKLYAKRNFVPLISLALQNYYPIELTDQRYCT